MSDSFQPGDLVTGRSAPGRPSYLSGVIPARPAGGVYWILQLPLHSIMTVAEAMEIPHHDQHRLITVLHDGRLVEVFANDLQRLPGAEQ